MLYEPLVALHPKYHRHCVKNTHSLCTFKKKEDMKYEEDIFFTSNVLEMK